MPSVVIGRSPSEDTGESMFLIPERLLQPNYSTREQCDAFLGRWGGGEGNLGDWALWREVPDTELSVSNPAEPPPGCRDEIRESFTLHRDPSSHLVIDGLGGGLCPHPPLRGCLLLRGLDIFEAMLKNKRCFLSTLSPPSLHTTRRIHIHMRCTYTSIHIQI